jgi:hypothetical protein
VPSGVKTLTSPSSSPDDGDRVFGEQLLDFDQIIGLAWRIMFFFSPIFFYPLPPFSLQKRHFV